MDLGFDIGSYVSWKLILGGVVAMAGMGVMAIFMGAMNGTKVMKVPDGAAPDEHYRRWKAASLSKKLSRTAWFLLFMAIGLTLGGCGVVILEVVR